jgi:HlyD family type I secretion membrane fusion protein
LNQQQVRSIAATDQQVRSDIRAPYSGTVEKIAFAAMGDVVKPAEPIMEIVPDADQMIVEAVISPDDVDQVRAGQPAIVRFPAVNRAATPEIEGRVIYVATDRSENPEAKQSFFLARISLDQGKLTSEGLKLRSGMPAEVHIQTGNRSLLSYVFKPLRDQFARAFRDN